MPSILLSNYYSDKVLSVVKSYLPEGFDLISLEKPGKEEVINKIGNADYLLVGGRTKIDKQVLDAAPKLKMIQRSGVGLDSLNLEEINRRNIPIYVNQGVNANSVAEHTVMLMLSALKNLINVHYSMASGKWVKHEFGVYNHEIKGKTIGLLGLGNIGKRVAELLRSFGANVVYYKPNRLETEEEKKLNLNYVSFEKLLSDSDIISLHCSLNSSTKHIINADSILKMKKGVILINTSRGSLIEENALLDYLKLKQISFAALDVYDKEPLDEKSSLRNLENVILTSHISGITHESFSKMMIDAFENIRLFENKKFNLIEEKKII